MRRWPRADPADQIEEPDEEDEREDHLHDHQGDRRQAELRDDEARNPEDHAEHEEQDEKVDEDGDHGFAPFTDSSAAAGAPASAPSRRRPAPALPSWLPPATQSPVSGPPLRPWRP